jgi:hypothetical protein
MENDYTTNQQSAVSHQDRAIAFKKMASAWWPTPRAAGRRTLSGQMQ